MIRSAALALALCTTFAAAAQQLDSLAVPADTTATTAIARTGPWSMPHQLQLQASGLFDASTVYNDLLLGLRRGGFIDRDTRQRSSDALKDNNRFGQELLFRITYIGPDSLLGHARWRPMLSLAHHDVTGVRFTRDLYQVTFFGNAAYEDSTAKLAPSGYEQQRYQTLGFGVQDAQTSSYLRLDFVNGQTLGAARLRTADLYTAPDGTALQADLDGDYWSSDTTAGGAGLFHGWGLALSGRWNKVFDRNGRTAVLSLVAEDMGFVYWRSNSLRYVKDSTITYTGITVDNIFDLPDLVLGENELLDTLGIQAERGAFSRLLPFRVAAYCTLVARDRRWTWMLGLEQRYVPGFIPRASVQAHRQLGRIFALTALASYGGHGGARLGLGCSATLDRHLHLDVRSSNVIGLLSEQARGQALAVVLGVGW